MNLEQLKWALQAVDAKLITNLDDAEHKAAWLIMFAGEIRQTLAATANEARAQELAALKAQQDAAEKAKAEKTAEADKEPEPT